MQGSVYLKDEIYNSKFLLKGNGMKLIQVTLFSMLMGITVGAHADNSNSAECKPLIKQACITEGKVSRAFNRIRTGGDDAYDRNKDNYENLKSEYEELRAELRANNCGQYAGYGCAP